MLIYICLQLLLQNCRIVYIIFLIINTTYDVVLMLKSIVLFNYKITLYIYSTLGECDAVTKY